MGLSCFALLHSFLLMTQVSIYDNVPRNKWQCVQQGFLTVTYESLETISECIIFLDGISQRPWLGRPVVYFLVLSI